MTTPINVQVIDESDDPPVTEEPTPTQVEFNGTITGSPFETTVTVTGSQTVTDVPHNAGKERISRSAIQWTLLGMVVLLLAVS
ncbi:hypothetical protein CPB86DRAFT_790448 [Serendipita vermifera]|nr:hypothetical protein CPB86DRAFT_790448 [Serendipita vermifera]